MPSLRSYENINCEKCGTQTERNKLERHKNRCSNGKLFSPSCTKFLTNELSQCQEKFWNNCWSCLKLLTKCDKDIHSFNILQEHTWKEQEGQRQSATQIIDGTQIMGPIDDNSLKEELETCQQFLVESDMQNGRHRVFDFAMDTLDQKILLEKLEFT